MAETSKTPKVNTVDACGFAEVSPAMIVRLFLNTPAGGIAVPKAAHFKSDTPKACQLGNCL